MLRRPPPGGLQALGSITLDLELIGPRRRERQVALRLWQGASGPDGAISIYWMPNGALRLIHGACDVGTATGTLGPGETVRVTYVACAHGRLGRFDVVNHDVGTRQRLHTQAAIPACLSDALPRHPGFLSVAHVVAIAGSATRADDPVGIESGAIVATEAGPRPIDMMQIGDAVLGADGSSHAIAEIVAWDRLSLGRQAPVRLRAPYFGLIRDVVVTPATRLRREGAEVEYWCGTDTVLVGAENLINGRAVCRDRRQAVRQMFGLTLDRPACIAVNGCFIETPGVTRPVDGLDVEGPPVLDRAAAQAILAGSGRAA